MQHFFVDSHSKHLQMKTCEFRGSAVGSAFASAESMVAFGLDTDLTEGSAGTALRTPKDNAKNTS